MSLTTLLPVAAAHAATQEPGLRRSERIDLRRLGKVSDDERAVLRIEWRAGLSGVDETRRVDEMLEQLRRMEGTIASIGLLVRNLPAPKPAAPMVDTAPKTAESNGYDLRLMAANVAAAGLVALWWFRRRKSDKQPQSGATTQAAAAPGPVVASRREEPFVAITPVPAAIAEEPPHDASPLPLQREVAVPTASSGGPPALAVDAAEPAPAPAAPAVAAPEPVPPPDVPPADATVIIDFSLEEAGPEDVARKKDSGPKPPPAMQPAVVGTGAIAKGIEPTLQLAEIMLSMGLEQGAAQALVEYIEANPRHALYHWLKLLGIYRKRGLHKEFMETAEKLRLNFNIQAEDWATPATGDAPSLEKFSRVAEHIQKIWVQPSECIDYLERLLADNRDGERAGFPQAVAEEMLLLIEILKETSGANQVDAT